MIVTSSEIRSQRAVICLNFSLFVLTPSPTATAQTTIANTPPLLLNADTKLFGTALTMNSNGFEPLCQQLLQGLFQQPGKDQRYK